MVTPTARPNIYRVSFVHVESKLSQSEVVCYVRVLDNGLLEVNYSHHTNMARSVPIGPYEQTAQVRLPLTPLLVAALKANVAMELWNYFIGDERVRVLPARIGEDVESVDWDYNANGTDEQ